MKTMELFAMALASAKNQNYEPDWMAAQTNPMAAQTNPMAAIRHSKGQNGNEPYKSQGPKHVKVSRASVGFHKSPFKGDCGPERWTFTLFNPPIGSEYSLTHV